MTDWEFWWDVKGTARREEQLRKAALLLPRRKRRPAEGQGLSRPPASTGPVLRPFHDAVVAGVQEALQDLLRAQHAPIRAVIVSSPSRPGCSAGCPGRSSRL